MYGSRISALVTLATLGLATTASAAVSAVDLGVVAPPGTVGGYLMGAFSDPSPEGTMTVSLAPPPAFPGTGNLLFTTPAEHSLVGSLWDTWSHGYTGSVYFNEDHDLLLALPVDTMAFYLYVQPNLKAVFEFTVDSSATTVTFDIDGNGGARGIGFYSDDPFDPLQYVYIRQTTMDSDGFAVGEFGINVIPEAGGFGIVLGGLALGFGAAYRRQRN